MYQADTGGQLATSLALLSPNYKKLQELKDLWSHCVHKFRVKSIEKV
jgi:hypothetical protein